MPDYIPQSDAEFDQYQEQFVAYALANAATLGLGAGNVASLTAANAEWVSSFASHYEAQLAARAALTAKNYARENLKDVIRQLTAKVQGNNNVTDAQRKELGITVRTNKRTPKPTPTSAPRGIARTDQRLRITLDWRDENTPRRRKKPEGVRATEIYVKVGGEAPIGLSECTYVATATRAPYSVEFKGEQANQMAHFILRWVNTRGEPGPISETVSATITG